MLVKYSAATPAKREECFEKVSKKIEGIQPQDNK